MSSAFRSKEEALELNCSPLGDETLADDPGPIAITDDEDDGDEEAVTEVGEGAMVRDGAAGLTVGVLRAAVGARVEAVGVPVATAAAVVRAAVGLPAVYALPLKRWKSHMEGKPASGNTSQLGW